MASSKSKKRIHVGEFITTEKIRNNILEILESGRISEGVKVSLFEKKWAEFIGTKYSIALNSGTSALIAGLEAIKIRFPNKIATKIITTPVTYIATINAISLTDFDPVFVDIDKETFGILPQAIEEHLENVEDPQEYSIILPVHLMGYPVEIDKIKKISKSYNLLLVEDSAQAHGTVYKGQKVGTFSLSRSQGKCPHHYEDFDPRFTHNLIGYNFKTMEFQAAIALAQLEEVDDIIKKRQKNVKILNEYLSEYSDMLQLPKYSEEVSYLGYPIIIKDENLSTNKLTQELESEGIENRPLFGYIPHQPAFEHLRKKYEGKLPNAEYIGKNGFYIGCHQYLSDEDLLFISEKFKKIMSSL